MQRRPQRGHLGSDGRLSRSGTGKSHLATALAVEAVRAGKLVYFVALADLVAQLVNACYEKGEMILTSNRGFAEWGDIFASLVVATALLDRLLHHAIVIQIEESSYRMREHGALLPESVRANTAINPATPKRRGRPPKTPPTGHQNA